MIYIFFQLERYEDSDAIENNVIVVETDLQKCRLENPEESDIN